MGLSSLPVTVHVLSLCQVRMSPQAAPALAPLGQAPLALTDSKNPQGVSGCGTELSIELKSWCSELMRSKSKEFPVGFSLLPSLNPFLSPCLQLKVVRCADQ